MYEGERLLRTHCNSAHRCLEAHIAGEDISFVVGISNNDGTNNLSLSFTYFGMHKCISAQQASFKMYLENVQHQDESKDAVLRIRNKTLEQILNTCLKLPHNMIILN